MVAAILDHVKVFAPLRHLFIPQLMFILGMVTSWLATTDVTVNAICNGREQCSEVIYLTSGKSAVSSGQQTVLPPQLFLMNFSESNHYNSTARK